MNERVDKQGSEPEASVSTPNMEMSTEPPQPNGRRETVILIHGTFGNEKDANDAGRELSWWRPGSSFVKTLDDELGKLGSNARCWHHLTEPILDCDLCDENNDSTPRYGLFFLVRKELRDRSYARRCSFSDDARLVNEDGWRFHFVAHSHGTPYRSFSMRLP